MDPVKRKTLNLMELATFRLPADVAGYHLILIAADWVREGEMSRATHALSLVTDDWLQDTLPLRLAGSQEFREAVALLIEALGIVDFRILKKTGLQA